MKREQLVWLLAVAAGATPLLEKGQGAEYQGLRFGLDGKFKISVFEDLHFGEAQSTEWGPEQDRKTIKVVNSILDNEPTNLAILNGDLITGEDVALDNGTLYLDQVLSPLLERKIPWASAYGNHDHSRTLSTQKLMEREQSIGGKLAYTKSMVWGEDHDIGTSNYYVPVYSSTGGGNPTLKLLLWFFDSKAGRQFGKTGPDGKDVSMTDWVDPKVSTIHALTHSGYGQLTAQVVAWFNLENAAIKQDFQRVIPSLAFVHIPVHATWSFQQKGGLRSAQAPGINEEIIGHQANTCVGDECNYNGNDTPFMQALVGTEGLIAVFSGHDHGIDWCMKWSATKPLPSNTPATGNNLNLCFGRHTGYGGYGKWTRGARQILLDESLIDNRELETWIRLENGKVSGHVMLNETYGKDKYPVVTKTYIGEVEEEEGKGETARAESVKLFGECGPATKTVTVRVDGGTCGTKGV
ncbi:Metallo-dependent phosphatase [Amniculicola lignicola CBS 123094]|uniref:Metallo-dependent phosphatase n=1 Tax=Amniculicola lignicola CBS 123094 TaxID=1392246 RepID=A0A6A5WXV3_9PLEO|nr:Metallo-dependent phosphatase [Amniculicola lignicola CBS 123094]